MKKFNPKTDPIDYFRKYCTWELYCQASNVHHDTVIFSSGELFPYPVLNRRGNINGEWGLMSPHYMKGFELLRLSTMLEF